MIWIEVLDIPWEPGKKLKLRAYRDFEYWLAKRFVKQVVKAIDSQLYKSKWPPLSRRYLDIKRQEGLSSNMWEATSELKTALKVKKSRRLVVGFDGRRHHKNSSREKYIEIAKRLEFGSSIMRIPPRPLFREVFRWMDSNLSRYYLLYRKEIGQS